MNLDCEGMSDEESKMDVGGGGGRGKEKERGGRTSPFLLPSAFLMEWRFVLSLFP